MNTRFNIGDRVFWSAVSNHVWVLNVYEFSSEVFYLVGDPDFCKQTYVVREWEISNT